LLKELTKMCEKITINMINFIKIRKKSIYDIPCYISDNRLVSRVYGWKPKHNIFNVINDVYLCLKKNKSKIRKHF